VQWYSGGDDADARASVNAKVDDSASVNYGAQANENGTVNLVRGLAVLSIQNFTIADPTSQGRFDAIATRNLQRMSTDHTSEPGSIQMLTVEIGNAKTSLSNISARQTSYAAQLQGMASDIETIPEEDVATQILALQTRLQASYQATSMIAHLSLVNYLGPA
jgi:flagellar hook-associated protein 3 FlgL